MTAPASLTYTHPQSGRRGAGQLPLPQALERLPAVAYPCDAAGRISSYNQHAPQLWGSSRSLTSMELDSDSTVANRAVELPPAAIAAGPPARAQPAERATILVVDDDAAVRDLIGRVLVRAGFQMCEASDGRAGLLAFAQHQGAISAILLDLTMPQLDGLEVLQELRRLGATAPVLLMSGYSRHTLAARTADLAVDGFIEKPFQLDDLLAELRRVLPRP